MSIFEKQLIKIIDNNKTKLSPFIQRKVFSKFFTNQKRKELVRLLPLIISNTDSSNRGWFDVIQTMSNTPQFLDTIIENIHNLDFQNNEFLLFHLLVQFLPLTLEEYQLQKIINEVLECNCRIDSIVINTIHSLIENTSLIENMLNLYLTNEKTSQTTIYFITKYPKYQKFLYQNINDILNIKNINLFELKRITKENELITNKIKNKIEETKKESIHIMIKNICSSFLYNIVLTYEESQKLETILEIFYLIVEDISKNEQVKLSNMKELGSGSFSTVLELGNKVIKIGRDRGTKTFHNNPYVNAMLLRKEFPLNDQISIFIEVSEKLDTKKEISKEELYQLYKKVRELHLIWKDVAIRNVGRLLKDNKVYWKEELPITDERLGLQPYIGNVSLKKGDIIILDNDLIFDENTEEKIMDQYINPLQKKFEQRYQYEKNHEQTIKVDSNPNSTKKK